MSLDASVGSVGDAYDCENNQGSPGRSLTLDREWLLPWR